MQSADSLEKTLNLGGIGGRKRRGRQRMRWLDDTTLMAESEEELKSLLMKVKEESEKVGFKAQLSEN